MSTKKQQSKKEITSEELQKQLDDLRKAGDDQFIAEYKELCVKHNREFNIRVAGTVGEALQGILFVVPIKKA